VRRARASVPRPHRNHDGARAFFIRETTTEKGDDVQDLEQRATTEALFRDVNERIAESAERFDAGETEFICECSDASCTHRVAASLVEYEEVRGDPARFLLVPGHEQDDIERVVSDRGRFRIVEKFQAVVRRTVVRLDPRRPKPSET
jgi:hypothetical protein